ncbi:hypothetical protein A0H81_05791 [Grifola frondosa]|uniref:Uncharacterized protein n=1 Tax=Grifola frondosa TaxID=5627 RepID=A0A1C7ME44_GRIFR|nr:hypothetical protein A0H81_05791 [Grifola frondosa]
MTPRFTCSGIPPFARCPPAHPSPASLLLYHTNDPALYLLMLSGADAEAFLAPPLQAVTTRTRSRSQQTSSSRSPFPTGFAYMPRRRTAQ